MNAPLMFGNAGDERGTPQDFFDKLNAEFHFTLDAAASALNAKCDLYFGEGGLALDALEQDWGGPGSVVFLNCPYSTAGAFVAKAREEADKGALVVLLLPVRSDTKWWHSHVWDKTAWRGPDRTPDGDTNPDGDWRPGVRTRLLSGRLEFELTVPDDMRAYIVKSLSQSGPADKMFADAILSLSKETGLPKMALERIVRGMPDDCLLDSAPFPSCVIVFSQRS